MLLQAFLASGLLIFGARCDLYSELSLLNNQDPFSNTWGWENPRFNARGAPLDDDVEMVPPKANREPLSPDYKDPASASSEQNPVLKPKPHEAANRPAAPAPVLPGGVIDVDASGLPALGNPFGPDFDFSSSFGISNSKPDAFGFGEIFGAFDTPQWWKGKHVCIEREESTDDDDDEDEDDAKNQTSRPEHGLSNIFSTSIRLSNCFEAPNKYECVTKINNHGIVKTFTVRYKCCYGYKRGPHGGECAKQADLKPLLETLEDVKVVEFRNLIKSTGLDEKFTGGNFSLLAPTDDALNDYNDKLNEMNNVDPLRRRRALKNPLSSKDLVLSHTVEGFIDLNEICNDGIIKSENNNSTIRINVYPTHSHEKLITANCARIKKSNVLTNNGIIHITEAVVVPATEDVETIIRQHPRLTSLKKALEKTDIYKHMKPDGHYTVFAPTDEAFNKLDAVQKDKILNGGGCADSILKHHFTAHTVCSSAIIGNATTHNVEGEVLNLERTVEDKLIFEGKANIVDTDIIALNGVIHLIDEVIIPDSGLYIGSVLKNQNFTKFQELVEKAGLLEEINGLNNATVFVPTDEAFESSAAKKLVESIQNDPEKLKEFIRYHTVPGQLQSGDMNNNVKLSTYDGGKELRINLYSTLPLFTNIVNRATVNCARLIGFDEKACGSVIHEINSVLAPPTKNILEVINSDDKYSTLREILKDTEVEKILQENNRSITFLAPTDETFAALDEKDRKTLRNNKEKANIVLKNHVLTEVLCCSGVGPQSWGFSSFVPTLGNHHVEVGRTGSQIRINRAVVTSCDNLATNGIVHTINKVLLPRRPQVPSIGGGFFLFDI